MLSEIMKGIIISAIAGVVFKKAGVALPVILASIAYIGLSRRTLFPHPSLVS
jgi:hypothetical protein